MRFKEVGRRVQVWNYSGYDRSIGRGRESLLGSLDRFETDYERAFRPSEKLGRALTEDEQAGIRQWLAERQRQSDDRLAAHSPQWAADYIERAVAALVDGQAEASTELAQRLWRGMGALNQALRKLGHRKPRASRVVPQTDARQVDLVAEVERPE